MYIFQSFSVMCTSILTHDFTPLYNYNWSIPFLPFLSEDWAQDMKLKEIDYLYSYFDILLVVYLSYCSYTEHFFANFPYLHLFFYEGWLKSLLADQDTLLECDGMRFIFQHSLHCRLHTCSIRVAVVEFYWSKKSSQIWHHHMSFSANECFCPYSYMYIYIYIYIYIWICCLVHFLLIYIVTLELRPLHAIARVVNSLHCIWLNCYFSRI